LLESELNEVVYLELPLVLELCIVSFPIEDPDGDDAYRTTEYSAPQVIFCYRCPSTVQYYIVLLEEDL